MQTTMRLGAEGMRIVVSGPLAGAEIARVEQYREGGVPLHTLLRMLIMVSVLRRRPMAPPEQ